MSAARKKHNLVMRTDSKTELLLHELVDQLGISKSEVVRLAIMNLAKEKLDKEKLVEILMETL